MTENERPTNPVAYAELQTTDPNAARAFYGELLGWKSEEEATPAGPYWTFTGVLAGVTAPRDGVPPGWIVPHARRRVRGRRDPGPHPGGDGAPRLHRDPAGTFSVVRDPTGGVVGPEARSQAR